MTIGVLLIVIGLFICLRSYNKDKELQSKWNDHCYDEFERWHRHNKRHKGR